MELIQGFVFTLLPPETDTIAAASKQGLDEGYAIVNSSNGNLKIVHVCVVLYPRDVIRTE